MGVRREDLMNYYFLLEDEKSLIKVLPTWLQHLNFNCKRVADISEITENTYVMQSGQGVTQLITKALFSTIDTIIMTNNIDKLVIIIDTEDITIEERVAMIQGKINERYKCVSI